MPKFDVKQPIGLADGLIQSGLNTNMDGSNIG